MSKPVTEDELIAKATGPRVTKEELEANVAGYGIFNVYEALTALGVPALDATKLLTIAVVTTKNGFTVVGESACAWPANFDADIGGRLALGDAKNKLWALMGYHLKEQLFTNTHPSQGEAPTGEGGAPETQPERSEGATTWEDRVRQEGAELRDRLEKLDLFIADDFKFLSLPDRQQRLLKEQREAMNSYLTILGARLDEDL